MTGEPKGYKGIWNVLASELVMGTLVALLSVMTAFAAYQGTLANSTSSDANVEGQKILSLSNTEFLRANQDILQDYTMFDGYYLNQNRDPDVAAYYEESFSDILRESIERESGPFDNGYYDGIYADADASFDEALLLFEEAQLAGKRADEYQLVVLIFAVGLALVAWASLVQQDSRLQPTFVLISMVISLYGLVLFLDLFLSV